MSEGDTHNQIMFMLGEIRSDIKSIKEQTTKTNGRVNEHDKMLGELVSDKDQRKGGIKVLMAVWSVITATGAILIDHLFFNKS